MSIVLLGHHGQYHHSPLAGVLERLGERVTRRERDGGYLARCPAHDDRRPSLRIAEGRDGVVLIRCRAGCDTTSVLASLGLELRHLFPRYDAASPCRVACPPTAWRESTRATASPWTPSDARRTWLLALGRARDDARIATDHDTYRYLASRRLTPALAEDAVGILHPELELVLPATVRWWPREGYRIVVPLFDQAGELVEIQARSIDPAARCKTLFPRGGRGSGRMFAWRGAREMLVGCGQHPVVVVGEGLSDFLALIVASPVPVVAVAGVGAAASAIGEWVRSRHVIVALDRDAPGERAAQDVADRVGAQGGTPWRLTWPVCKDACELLKTRGEDGLAEVLDRAVEEVYAQRNHGDVSCTMSD